MSTSHDAVLIVAFGGPEGPDDVMPFLENVVRGRGIPRERLLEVAAHYDRFGGVSPINQQVLGLIRALVATLNEKGPHLPVYWRATVYRNHSKSGHMRSVEVRLLANLHSEFTCRTDHQRLG